MATILDILRNEILNDPDGEGYSGMTDQQVADFLNDPTQVSRDVKSVSRAALLDAVDPDESKRLLGSGGGAGPVADKDYFQLLMLMESIPLNASNIKARLAQIFDAVNYQVTRPALIALQRETISKAKFLGIPGPIQAGDVAEVRR